MLCKKQRHSDSSKITFTQHLYQTAFPHCHHGLPRKSKTHPTEDNRASLHADLLSHSVGTPVCSLTTTTPTATYTNTTIDDAIQSFVNIVNALRTNLSSTDLKALRSSIEEMYV